MWQTSDRGLDTTICPRCLPHNLVNWAYGTMLEIPVSCMAWTYLSCTAFLCFDAGKKAEAVFALPRAAAGCGRPYVDAIPKIKFCTCSTVSLGYALSGLVPLLTCALLEQHSPTLLVPA